MSAFSALLNDVVAAYIPVPYNSQFPAFNIGAKDWIAGPIPEGTICIKILSLREMQAYWALQADENISNVKIMSSVILASLCDHNGVLFASSPEKPLDFSDAVHDTLNSKLSAPLALHIYESIQEFSGWVRKKAKIADPVETAAKNSSEPSI